MVINVIYKTAYDTTVGKTIYSSEKDKITREIVKVIRQGLPDDYNQGILGTELKPYVITGWDPIEDHIPSFTHPLVIEDRDKKFIAVDVRPFVKKAIPPILNAEELIRNKVEYKYAVNKLILTMDWIESSDAIAGLNNFDKLIYTNWITNILAFTYSLDPEERLRIKIATYLYYKSLLVDNVEEEYMQAGILQIGKLVGVTYKTGLEYAEGLEKNPEGIADLLENLKKCSPRLNGITLDSFVSLLSGGWFGLDRVNNIIIAITHPPTWNAILYSLVETPAFKRSQIVQSMRLSKVRSLEDAWKKEMNSIIHDYIE